MTDLASQTTIDRQVGQQDLLAAAARMSEQGLRVLAFAEKMTPHKPGSQTEAESDLTFVGLAGLNNPVRPEAAASIAAMVVRSRFTHYCLPTKN